MQPQALRDQEVLNVRFEGQAPQHEAQPHEWTDIEVEPENWIAVQIFQAMDTQWRITPLPRPNGSVIVYRTGLDLGALDVVAASFDAQLDRELLAAIKTLETEAVGHFARRTNSALSGR